MANLKTGVWKKTKHVKFSQKQTILTLWYALYEALTFWGKNLTETKLGLVGART